MIPSRPPIHGPVLLSDALDILAAAREWCQDMIATKIIGPRALPDGDQSAFWIGTHQRRPLALTTFYEVARDGLKRRRWWIDIVHVRDEFRREGFGRDLVAAIIDEARRDGVAVVLMGVGKDNDAMLRLAGECEFQQDHVVLRREVSA